jgi:hypothetical protein
MHPTSVFTDTHGNYNCLIRHTTVLILLLTIDNWVCAIIVFLSSRATSMDVNVGQHPDLFAWSVFPPTTMTPGMKLRRVIRSFRAWLLRASVSAC